MSGIDVWITSAVEDKVVEKAITLAGSLRRVRTAKKLVVITTAAITEERRDLLKDAFDLVLFLEQKNPNGLSLEDYAKVQAFSFLVFNKCVYLSPSALVLKNCDEIFGKYTSFAVAQIGPNDIADPSIYVFTPNLEYHRALSKLAHNIESNGNQGNGDFQTLFNVWLRNNIPNMERLHEQYNTKLSLRESNASFASTLAIVNFTGIHPLDCPEHVLKQTEQEFGIFEKFAVEQCWKIYTEDVKKSTVDGTYLSPKDVYKTEPIAIIGMSFRLPGANNVDEFWSLLAEGRNAVCPVPSFRWTKEHSLVYCKNRKVEAGFLNVTLDEFDSKFFSLSPKEAEFLDPQQRLLLEVTWEALEDAMIDPLMLKGTQTGVFVGSWLHDYKDICCRSVDVDFFRTYMGNSIASTAARLSHFLETTGPSIATESGCSSAIAAVDMACKSLRNRNSDFAIAAGVNLFLHPFDQGLLEYVLSPDYRCKTFDAGANGFARAEACATLLMKRLSDAVKDEDNILGLVRGTALTQEGISKSLGTPTIYCESLAMELALSEADVAPADVSYIEAHGTGTPVGDPMEISAINKVYSKGRTEPLLVGSVKTNVGHTESVSGITGIIKVLLSMKNELIPKHLNLKTLNPQINLESIPAHIPLIPTPWPKREDTRRIAGVSSFGISGTDGHAIIEEPPIICQERLKFYEERPLHIMKISAKSSESMDELLQQYLQIFEKKVEKNEDSEQDFANLAYSANIGRATFNHRVVIVAKNFASAAKILKEKTFKQSDIQTSGNKLCFLFTGQGSQYPNMAKELYETSPVFKETFEKCNEVLQRRYNLSITGILWPDAKDAEEIHRTLYSQVSIFVVEYCLLRLWESWGVTADYVLGHSLGEFAASVAAGALNFEDALMLVAERSRLIDNLPRGKMLVIKANKKKVDKEISEFKKIRPKFWVDYAALNSPDQTVVAGDSENIEEFSKFCKEKSLKSIVLAATHAFHSRHMDPILSPYKKVVSTVKKSVKNGELPKYISGMEGKLVEVEKIDSEYWVRHTREKVNFQDACREIEQEGCTLFLEIGPHPVLSALTMMNFEGHQITCFPSLRKKEQDWITMLESLSKLYLSEWKGEINWKGFDRFYKRQKTKLPFYPFNRKPTWTKIDTALTKIHPLIGSLIPTASNETIYKNLMTSKNASFTNDHVIGNTVVFPGAGFLEMCLAGGHAAVQGYTENLIKPRRPIVLKSLQVKSPMALHESGVCKLQTVISLNDKDEDDDSEVGYSVGVHRQADTEDGTGKWIQHASAKFLPVAPSVSKDLMESIDIGKIQSSWERTDNKDFYEKLPEVGLRFGPRFQSLECGWKSDIGFLASVKVPENCEEYLVHPVVADAMIQAVLLWSSKEKEILKKKLQVPVQVGEFIWLKDVEDSKALFVYCSTRENNDVKCVLVNKNGRPLASMKGVDFFETTAKLVEGMITQQTAAMPKLWEDVWKSSRGPMQGYFTHTSSPEELSYSEDDLKLFHEMNDIPPVEQCFYNNLVNITRLSFLKAMYDLGWAPIKFETFSIDELIRCHKIKDGFQQYIRFFLRSLTEKECALLRAMDSEETTFQFLENPPTKEDIARRLTQITNPNEVAREDYRLIMEVGKNLSKIFIGEEDTLAILFPNDSAKPSAEKYYASLASNIPERAVEAKICQHIAVAKRSYSISSSGRINRPVYRGLEVGAGTGAFTKKCLEHISAMGKDFDFEYHFTDVTPAFFSAAEKAVEKYLSSMIFKRYDMEKDPLEQGLCPGYFDCVCAFEVLHIGKDIKKVVKSLRSLLKPGGLIIIAETIYPDERNTFVFGLLDAFWQFQDREFRKNHITLTPEMWEETLKEGGFHGVSVTPFYKKRQGVVSAYAAPIQNNFLAQVSAPTKSWIVFGDNNDDFTEGICQKLSEVNRKCFPIPKPLQTNFTETAIHEYIGSILLSAKESTDIEGIVYLWSLAPKTRDQSKVSLPLVTLMKLISDFKTPPRVFVLMQGTSAIKTSHVIDPTPGTLVGFCKSISNENLNLNVTSLDLDPNKDHLNQLDEVFMNFWVTHKQSCAFRDGHRLCPKLAAGKILRNEPLPLPSGCDRFQLVLPKTRLISDLEFAYLEPYVIGEDEVEVQVKAMALNFRDVFTILKPIPDFESFNTVGLDFAGFISKIGQNVTQFKVGDRVMGMNMGDNVSLPSHLKTKANRIVSLPGKMTFAEGVTLPAVFSTAVYCLIYIAKIKKGETVLIHTASGGVGLVAIQLCKYIEANIIATAGSQRKRTYLKNLGIKHVFHSRTTDFKNEILKATEGRGVEIVLNSLTGPGFKEASLDVLSKNGRFIEMSKLNAWTPEEVKALRPDVFYRLVDLTQLESHEYDSLVDELRKFTDADFVKPIAYEKFDALNIRGALNYLQKAKHIGKIVCVMPEIKLKKSKLITFTPLFNGDSTYLVTGGLGGIGFEVVKWMLKNGANHVAIVSRSSPKPEIAAQIEKWNKSGKHVQAFSVDVGNYEKCKELFEELKKPELGFPQLRGVMHAAGVLHDAVLENQSWDTFLHTYNPKVAGSWNLHELTKDYLLEHFVLFSSMAALFGSPGQTNHSASNAYEDALAAYRKSIGLPATCINWGNWGEVGVATEIDFPGVRPISTSQGLIALETFLKTQTSHMSVLNVEAFSLLLKLFPLVRHYIDDFRLLGDSRTSMIVNSDEFWNEVDSASDREGKVVCFKKFIKTVVRNILKMEPEEQIDDQTEFQTLGIDSLMMLEMKNGMQNILGGRMTLTANQLKDCNNTEVLANTLVDILEGEHDDDKNLPSHEELKQLIRDDSNLLPELSVENLKSKPLDQIETVLLTGVTGNLGPYLLRDLMQRSQITKVYCLIRPNAKLSGVERLKGRLEQMKIIDSIDMNKVQVVEGDITSKKFGLDDEYYFNLCENVDAVIHSAVKADHFAKYWKAPETRKSHVRSVNVFGTIRILEFAAERTLKYFYYASTLLTFTGTGKDGKFSEGWQAVDVFDSYKAAGKLGYVITKHISEQLIYQAILKGIPCKAFRFPIITGDSKTGRVDFEKNHAILRWLTCMKIGAIHDLPAPIMTIPVDQCANISLSIFFHPEAPMDVYNVVQMQIEVEQVLVEVAEAFGIKMEIVTYEEFLNKLKMEDEKSPVSAFTKLYMEGESEVLANFESPSAQALKRYLEEGSNFLDTTKLQNYVPKYENIVGSMSQVLIRDFTYLKNEGILEKYGIIPFPKM